MHLKNSIEKFISIVEIWQINSKKYSQTKAVIDDYSNITLTYEELNDYIKYFAAALQSLGVTKNMHAVQFSENSAKWLIADQALMCCGAVNAVRSSQAPMDELNYIYNHSDSKFLITDSVKLLEKLYSQLSSDLPNFVILLTEEDVKSKYNVPIYTFDELIEMGKNLPFNPVEISSDDMATIVYSSGTTGKPKGIVLTHGNIASQIKNLPTVLDVKFPSKTLNVLPIWHMYERTCEYYLFSQGSSLYYTNIRNLKKDLNLYKPNYLISVPRLWEALYEGINKEIKTKNIITQKMFSFFINTSKKHKKSKRIHTGNCIDNLNPSFTKNLWAKLQDISLYPVHQIAETFFYSKIREAVGGCLIKGISGGGALARNVEDFYEAINVSICVGYGLT
ncbi:MAG: AMP-binding protein, partial [Candidatus Gastranaerophilaceae bacterium]